MNHVLDESALAQLFREARSLHTFRDTAVTDATLHALYDLLKWGPTAFNAQPGRYLFVRSAEGKARLLPTLSSANQEKTLRAPLTVIVAFDSRFLEHLAAQSMNPRAVDWFAGNDALTESTAFRNGTLQGAYLLMAARALGLAVGPMSGFNPEAVNREFFADGRYRVNFLVNLGYADDTAPRPRGPRLEFAEVAEIV